MPWQKSSLVSLFVIIIALLTMISITSGSHFSQYKKDIENNENYCESAIDKKNELLSKECQSIIYRTLDDPVALLTGGLTIATIALFIVTFGLFVAASKQGVDAKEAVKITRETSERQLRAYIGKESISFAQIGETGRVVVRTVYKNFGQTPAINFDARLRLSIQTNPIGEPSMISFDEAIRDDVSLMPGATGVVVCELDTSNVPDVRGAVGRSELTILLTGCFVYSDIFGRSHVARVVMQAVGQRALSQDPFTHMPGNMET